VFPVRYELGLPVAKAAFFIVAALKTSNYRLTVVSVAEM
jgi:hypothetical protein